MTDRPERQEPRKGLARCCLGAIGRICLSRVLHGCVHIAWRLVKLSAVVLFLLWAVGIPGNWLEGKLQPHIKPYQLKAARITWSPLDGLIIHDGRAYETNVSSMALVSVDTCIIRPSYRQLLQRHWVTSYIEVRGGTAIFPSRMSSPTNIAEQVGLNHVNGRITFDPDQTVIDMKAISEMGTKYTILGSILKPANTNVRPESSQWQSQLHRLHRGLHDTPKWITFTRDQFKAASFTSPPEATVTFNLDPDWPSKNNGTLEYHASSFTCHGQSFDGIDFEAGVTGGIVRIEKANLQQGSTRINLTGYFDAPRNVCEVHMYNDMPPQAVIPFLTKSWREKMKTAGLKLEGSMQAEAWIGPCKLEDVPTNWGGWTIIEKAQLNNFPVERAFASFKRTAGQLIVEDGLIKGGTGIGKGTFGFSINTDYENRISRGHLDIGFELKQVSSMLPRGVRIAADMFEIAERPVRFNGSYTLPLDNIKGLFVEGAVSGTNGTFRGAPLTGINTYATYSNAILTLDPFHVTCATGGVTGSLVLDLKNQQYGVNLEITTNPKSIAPMMGSNAPGYFTPYRFTDEILAKVRGMIDAKEDRKTDLSVVLSGRNFGADKFTFDRLNAEAHRGPGTLLISNIYANAYEGTITGTLAIALQPNGNRFDLDARMDDLSFDAVSSAITLKPTNQYEGRITGQVFLQGKFPDAPRWKNLRGTGYFIIKDGRLLQIPLFGGLSTLLSKIFPGLGFSEQNHLEASVSFEGGAVHSDDIKLSGSMISISGRGSYDWKDDLNLYVQVHPFRDGSIASILRIVTIPISYMLEFKATGPRKDPTWRPANIPL
jgi:AsmA-like C-terminal region